MVHPRIVTLWQTYKKSRHAIVCATASRQSRCPITPGSWLLRFLRGRRVVGVSVAYCKPWLSESHTRLCAICPFAAEQVGGVTPGNRSVRTTNLGPGSVSLLEALVIGRRARDPIEPLLCRAPELRLYLATRLKRNVPRDAVRVGERRNRQALRGCRWSRACVLAVRCCVRCHERRGLRARGSPVAVKPLERGDMGIARLGLRRGVLGCLSAAVFGLVVFPGAAGADLTITEGKSFSGTVVDIGGCSLSSATI